MVEVKNMTRDELVEELKLLRDSRKKGYTQAPKVRRKKNDPFQDIPTDLAEKLLAELMKGDIS